MWFHRLQRSGRYQKLCHKNNSWLNTKTTFTFKICKSNDNGTSDKQELKVGYMYLPKMIKNKTFLENVFKKIGTEFTT